MTNRDISASFPGIFIVHQNIPGNEVAEHQHKEHEFFIPLQGEINIQTDATQFKAGPGKMIYLPPGTTHSFRSSSSTQGERLILIVNAKAWKAYKGVKMGPAVLSASQLCKEILFHLLIHPKTKASKALIATLIQTLSEMLEGSGLSIDGDPFHLARKSGDTRIQMAIEVIEKNFTTSLITEKIARSSGMSLRNFNRLFLAEIGLSPKQLITHFRIEQAKQLLKNGKHTVTDVSLEVCYNSVSQFITTFRKHTGQLPSSFLPLKI